MAAPSDTGEKVHPGVLSEPSKEKQSQDEKLYGERKIFSGGCVFINAQHIVCAFYHSCRGGQHLRSASPHGFHHARQGVGGMYGGMGGTKKISRGVRAKSEQGGVSKGAWKLTPAGKIQRMLCPEKAVPYQPDGKG
ncbi:MAG: hypothetical protein OEZ59_12285 [Deltaproteobacteria bacterium]|nr:hypothetical protein [Deltaproteobacteria bacterium]